MPSVVRKPPVTMNGIVAAEAALLEVGRAELDRDREVVPDRPDHLEQEARAVLGAATPVVVAPVGDRREELRDQIAVRGVDLDAGEAAVARDGRDMREPADQIGDLGDGRRARLGGSFAVPEP